MYPLSNLAKKKIQQYKTAGTWAYNKTKKFRKELNVEGITKLKSCLITDNDKSVFIYLLESM